MPQNKYRWAKLDYQITSINLVNFRVKVDRPDCPICPIHAQFEIPHNPLILHWSFFEYIILFRCSVPEQNWFLATKSLAIKKTN